MICAYYASIVVSSTLFLFYGIACLFFEGMATRIRVLDSLAQTLPAVVLMCVNVFIAWVALGRVITIGGWCPLNPIAF